MWTATLLAGSFLLLLPATTEGAGNGTLMIAPLHSSAREADHDMPGEQPQRREPCYEFAISIDDRDPVVLPEAGSSAAVVTELDADKPHLVVIRDAGEQIESFWFSFESRGALRLRLEYHPWYQVWTLDRPGLDKKACRCDDTA